MTTHRMNACAWCHREFVVTQRGGTIQRYCSTDCNNAAARLRRRNTVLRPERFCARCAKPLQTTRRRNAVYCSRSCQAFALQEKAREEPTRRPGPKHVPDVFDREQSPEAWDGKTKYSEPTEPTFLWTRTCFICSREQTAEPERMTRRRANLIATAGIPNCVSCHGWVLLEELSLAGRTVVT